MKTRIGAAIASVALISTLAIGGPAAASAAVTPSKAGVETAGPQAVEVRKATDFSARRYHRHYHRYGYRPYYRPYPYYYARPYYYRPYPYYAPAPFPFGFGFGFGPWGW
jgi:hypothetical protein